MASIVALHRSDRHGFSKQPVDEVDLIAGVGVSGDVDAGALIRRAGIMGVVVLGGRVTIGDPIEWSEPPGSPRGLERV